MSRCGLQNKLMVPLGMSSHFINPYITPKPRYVQYYYLQDLSYCKIVTLPFSF